MTESAVTSSRTKSSMVKIGRKYRPKFRDHTLLTTWHLNYFKPIEVTKPILLRNGITKETIVVNPLTGLVEVSGLLFLSAYNKPKYKKPYRLWSVNKPMKDKLNKYLNLNLSSDENNIISLEVTPNNPNTSTEGFSVKDNKKPYVSLEINLPISIKEEFIEKIINASISDEIENVVTGNENLEVDNHRYLNFKNSTLSVIANRDIRTSEFNNRLINRSAYISNEGKGIVLQVNDYLLVDKHTDLESLTYVRYQYSFIPKTEDLVEYYEKLSQEDMYNNIYKLNEFQEDLISDKLYDADFKETVIIGKEASEEDIQYVNNPESTIRYGLTINNDTYSFRSIYGFTWVPHIAFNPDIELFNTRYLSGFMYGFDWHKTDFTNMLNPAGQQIKPITHYRDVSFKVTSDEKFGKIGEELNPRLAEVITSVENPIYDAPSNYPMTFEFKNSTRELNGYKEIRRLAYGKTTSDISDDEIFLDATYGNYIGTKVESQENGTGMHRISTHNAHAVNMPYTDLIDPIYRGIHLTSYLRDIYIGGGWLKNNLHVIKSNNEYDASNYYIDTINYTKFINDMIPENLKDVKKFIKKGKRVDISDSRDSSIPEVFEQFDTSVYRPGRFSFSTKLEVDGISLYDLSKRKDIYYQSISKNKSVEVSHLNYRVNTNHPYLTSSINVNNDNVNNTLPDVYEMNKLFYRPQVNNDNINRLFKESSRKPFSQEERLSNHHFIFNIPLNVKNKLSKPILDDKLLREVSTPIPENFADFPFNRMLPKQLNTYDAVSPYWVHRLNSWSYHPKFYGDHHSSINEYYKVQTYPTDRDLYYPVGVNEPYTIKSIANRLSFMYGLTKEQLLYKYNILDYKTSEDEKYNYIGTNGLPPSNRGVPPVAPPYPGTDPIREAAIYQRHSNVLEHPVYLYVAGMYNILYNLSDEYVKTTGTTLGRDNDALSFAAPFTLQTATAFAIATGVSSYFYKPTELINVIDSTDNFYSVDKENFYRNLTHYPSLPSYLSGIMPLYINKYKYNQNDADNSTEKAIEGYVKYINENDIVPEVIKYKPANFHQYITDRSYNEVGRMLTAFLLADWCEIKLNINGRNNSYKRINNHMVKYDINGTDGTFYGSPIIEDIGTAGTSMNELIVNKFKTRPEDIYSLDIRKFHGGFGFGLSASSVEGRPLISTIKDCGDLFRYMDFEIPCMYLGSRTSDYHYPTNMGPNVRQNYHDISTRYSDKSIYKHYAVSNYNELSLIKSNKDKRKDYDTYLGILSEALSNSLRVYTSCKDDGLVYKKSIFKDLAKAINKDPSNLYETDLWSHDGINNGYSQVTIDFYFNPLFGAPDNKASFTFRVGTYKDMFDDDIE